METLKIALIDLNTPVGGGHIALGNLARALSEKGHEIHVILGLKELNGRLKDLCVPHCNVHYVQGYWNFLNILSSIGRNRKAIERLCEVYDFDILHVQGLTGLFIPSNMFNRLIVTLHGNNIYRGVMLLKYSLSNFLNPHIAQYVRAILDDGFGSWIWWSFEKAACNRARRVITLSSFEAKLAEKYYGLSRDEVRVVPNPVVLPKEGYGDLPFINNEKALLTVSSLSLIKGTPLLVQASKHILSQDRKVCHVFLGTGPFSNLVENLASKFPGRIKMVPFASNEITSIYNNSTLLIHGSLYESQGLVLGEAMLAEKPVVAFHVASIPECVIDNVTGYLADPFNPKDLAKKALTLLEDDEKANKMGIMGRRRAMNLYSLPVIAGKVERVYREVLTDEQP